MVHRQKEGRCPAGRVFQVPGDDPHFPRGILGRRRPYYVPLQDILRPEAALHITAPNESPSPNPLFRVTDRK